MLRVAAPAGARAGITKGGAKAPPFSSGHPMAGGPAMMER